MRTISIEEDKAVLEVRHPGLVADIQSNEKDEVLAQRYGEKLNTIRHWRLALGVKRHRAAAKTTLTQVSTEELEAELERRKGQ